MAAEIAWLWQLIDRLTDQPDWPERFPPLLWNGGRDGFECAWCGADAEGEIEHDTDCPGLEARHQIMPPPPAPGASM